MDELIEALVNEGWEVIFRRVIVGDIPAIGIEVRRGQAILRGCGQNSEKLVSNAFYRAAQITPRLSDHW